MKTKTILTVSLIAAVILLVTGTSITSIVRTAFADANPMAPGQGQPEHRNPSGDYPPPGQPGKPIGNSGQCQKAGFDHDICHPNQ